MRVGESLVSRRLTARRRSRKTLTPASGSANAPQEDEPRVPGPLAGGAGRGQRRSSSERLSQQEGPWAPVFGKVIFKGYSGVWISLLTLDSLQATSRTAGPDVSVFVSQAPLSIQTRGDDP